ncbi:MAG: ankyrin repeat domain-containing protein [Alphaproteobacteria bacterium]
MHESLAIHDAYKRGDLEALKTLLAHGADLNARTQIDEYATPLEEVEILGREQSIAFLRKASENKT